jgi:hypothetical protein
MGRTAEYWESCSFSLQELNKATELTRVAWQHAKNGSGRDTIKSALESVGAAATVLALVFANVTTLGVASGLYGVISMGFDSYFVNGLEAAFNRMSANNYSFVANSSNWRRVEFDISFVEYDNGGVRTRYPMQASALRRIQLNDGTWISAE